MSERRGSTETPAADSPAMVAEQIFRASPYHAIHFLSCSFDSGVLTLSGRVPSFHLKQIAQTAVRDLQGVDRVVNLVEVAVL